jgi:hypothetical protein
MYLIIPDCHEQATKFSKIINKWSSKVKHIYFLGDFTDSFDGLTEQTQKIADIMRDLLHCNDFTALWGNHDLQYAHSDIIGLRCSGFDPQKVKIFNDALCCSWQYIKTHVWVDGWLLSHAGIHTHFEHPLTGMTKNRIEQLSNVAISKLTYKEVDPWFDAGYDRGGRNIFGGILWQDWKTLSPIDSISQLVGHSRGKVVRYKDNKLSKNICLDTDLNDIILMENGETEVVHLDKDF